jgi:hypothetical protein
MTTPPLSRHIEVWILYEVDKRHGHDCLGSYDWLLRHCEDLGTIRISDDLGALAPLWHREVSRGF